VRPDHATSTEESARAAIERGGREVRAAIRLVSRGSAAGVTIAGLAEPAVIVTRLRGAAAAHGVILSVIHGPNRSSRGSIRVIRATGIAEFGPAPRRAAGRRGPGRTARHLLPEVAPG